MHSPDEGLPAPRKGGRDLARVRYASPTRASLPGLDPLWMLDIPSAQVTIVVNLQGVGQARPCRPGARALHLTATSSRPTSRAPTTAMSTTTSTRLAAPRRPAIGARRQRARGAHEQALK